MFGGLFGVLLSFENVSFYFAFLTSNDSFFLIPIVFK